MVEQERCEVVARGRLAELLGEPVLAFGGHEPDSFTASFDAVLDGLITKYEPTAA